MRVKHEACYLSQRGEFFYLLRLLARKKDDTKKNHKRNWK